MHHMSAWYSCTFFNCIYCDFLCTFSNHLTWKSSSTLFVSIVFCCYTLLLYITMPVPGHPSALPFKFSKFRVYCFNHNIWDVLILSQVLFYNCLELSKSGNRTVSLFVVILTYYIHSHSAATTLHLLFIPFFNFL